MRTAVTAFLAECELATGQAAAALGFNRCTLSRWRRRRPIRAPGRPRWHASLGDCCRVLRTLARHAGRLSVRMLSKLFPQASRAWLIDVRRRDRRLRAARRRARLATLVWQ